MQLFILYSHRNNNVLNEIIMVTTALKSKTLKFQEIKLDKMQKINCFRTRSVKHNIEDELVNIDEKRRR